jgi:hypothetical protein
MYGLGNSVKIGPSETDIKLHPMASIGEQYIAVKAYGY